MGHKKAIKIKSFKMECPCPFCPLVAINLQVCDIKVIFMKNKVRFCSNIELTHCQEHITMIILYFRNNLKLKVGFGKNIKTSDYYCFVHRLDEDEFKFCFHSLKK